MTTANILSRWTLLCCLIVLFSPDCSFAQADWRASTLARANQPLTNTRLSYGWRYEGVAPSPAVKIKVWVSIDTIIDDTDVNSMSRLYPSAQVVSPIGGRVEYKLPITALDDRDLPFLTGDTRTPLEWIGERIYSRSCVMDAVGEVELACSGVRETLISPPTAIGVTTSNGISNNFIELSVQVQPDDEGSPLVDYIELSEIFTDQFGTTGNIDVVFDLNDIVNGNGDKYFGRRLFGRLPGKMYEYRRMRYCLTKPVQGQICTGNFFFARPRVGNTLGQFSASLNLPERIELSWERFAFESVGGYSLSRCEQNRPETCVILDDRVEELSYSDDTAKRGTNYIYHLEACDPRNDLVSLDRACSEAQFRYKMAISNIARVGLPDRYEDDDNSVQAVNVNTSVVQLRSFNTADDVDWVKLSLNESTSVEITSDGTTFNDTELTLYDVNLNLIDYNNNPENTETAYAALQKRTLTSGDYFIKVNQRFSPLPPLYRPVANYTLEIKLDTPRPMLVPVLQLLLDN